MRIIVNDIAAEMGGALTVLKSFYEYVLNHDKDNEYIFLLSDNYVAETDHIKVIICDEPKKSGLHKMKFDFVTGKKLIEKLKPDYVLSLQNIITFGLKCRQGVYVHQSIPFQKEKKFSLLKGSERGTAIIQRFIGAIIKKSVRKADDVFVQTRWMQDNVAEMSKVSSEKILVVPFQTEIPKTDRTARTYSKNRFFYPATFESVYKNQECIYQAADILNKQGITDFRITLPLSQDQQPKRKCVQHCGMLNKNDLYQMYAENTILFPSYIETIGLPLLEALSVNTLILAADCQYARESLDGYANALFFDPFSPEKLAELMRQTINGDIQFNNKPHKATPSSTKTWDVILDTITASRG